MRVQWNVILGLLFSLIVAIFAVVNVKSVTVNYLFGRSEIPLILVILGSALLGGLVVGMFGILRQYRLQRVVRKLEKELELEKAKENVDSGNTVISDETVVEKRNEKEEE